MSDKFLLSIIEHVLNKVFGPVGTWVPNMEPATLDEDEGEGAHGRCAVTPQRTSRTRVICSPTTQTWLDVAGT